MATGDRDFAERYAGLTKLAGDAADAVDDQIKQLRKAAEAGKDATVQKEAAILAALVARQSTADQHLATRSVLDRLDELTGELTDVSTTLKASVDSFAQTAEASTRHLAKWTKVMAWATIVLSAFAFAQVVVAILAWLRPH
jgi:hypothetical protein